MGKFSSHHVTATIPTNNVAPVAVKAKRTRKTIPRDSPPQRSSIYRGVTRHRWTGRYEAHLWDKNCWNEAQNKKGRQVYLGAYDEEEAAAHAYDLAALKYWGQDTILNFPLSMYQKEIIEMEGQSREEYIGSLRRKSSGFSRGVSKYRGVARHHHNGRWEARIGRVFGNKYLYLGTYATQEEAAIAYDMAAIEYRGLNAVTNFDLSRYIKWLRPNNNNNSTNINTTPATSNPRGPGSSAPLHLPNHAPAASSSQARAPTTATSALGLLLQSSKFKEMMEMTLAAECPPESKMAADPPPPPPSSIPEDVKTYFESNEFCAYNEHGDDFFGELNSFMGQPMGHDDQFGDVI
ncbi:AP2-like ethylene-responsive transcription factor At1g16060 [Andrographis paniculata]|uniref:AP2-like ethylene-responsive transcription factor At1g16060 n=1 Tax=Andrographis paniculata TaxID=175694 RepID=UPI0021E9AE74|nr:AP2-like ethylene-responsive transcription factor At1g16060 [Andrographis paniculata]